MQSVPPHVYPVSAVCSPPVLQSEDIVHSVAVVPPPHFIVVVSQIVPFAGVLLVRVSLGQPPMSSLPRLVHAPVDVHRPLVHDHDIEEVWQYVS